MGIFLTPHNLHTIDPIYYHKIPNIPMINLFLDVVIINAIPMLVCEQSWLSLFSSCCTFSLQRSGLSAGYWEACSVSTDIELNQVKYLISMFLCLHVCSYVCDTNVCMSMCVCVMCVYIYVYMCVYTNEWMSIYVCLYMYACTKKKKNRNIC